MKQVIALFLIGAALFGIGGCKQEPNAARVASGGEEKAYELLEQPFFLPDLSASFAGGCSGSGILCGNWKIDWDLS